VSLGDVEPSAPVEAVDPVESPLWRLGAFLVSVSSGFTATSRHLHLDDEVQGLAT
jgi:hypothetical protein